MKISDSKVKSLHALKRLSASMRVLNYIFIVSHMDLSCLFQRPESWVLGILLLTMMRTNEENREKL